MHIHACMICFGYIKVISILETKEILQMLGLENQFLESSLKNNYIKKFFFFNTLFFVPLYN